MGNTLGRIRKRGFAAALTITAVLAFGMLGATSPASAVDGTPSTPAPVSAETVPAATDAPAAAPLTDPAPAATGTSTAPADPAPSDPVPIDPAPADPAAADPAPADPAVAAPAPVATPTAAPEAAAPGQADPQFVWNEPLPQPGSSISGTVSQQIGSTVVPAGLALVSYSSAGEHGFGGSTRADADGHYTINRLSPGEYTLRFSADDPFYSGDPVRSGLNVISEYYNDAADAASATVVAVSASASPTGIDATLAQASKISGTVTYLDGGTRKPAAKVTVAAYSTINGGYVGDAATDAQGHYSIGSLPAGSYTVDFNADDSDVSLVAAYYGGAGYDTAKPIVVAAHATVPGIDATLSRGGTITGTLRQNVGGIVSAANNGYVNVYSADTGDYSGSASTDSSGRYAVKSLAAGEYKLQYSGSVSDSDNGFVGQLAPEYYGGAIDLSSATVIAVGAAQTVSGIDATMVLGSTISGTVKQSAGGAISNLDFVAVYVFSASSGELASATVPDEDGNYAVPGLHKGTYKVLFYTYRYGSGPGLAFQYYTGATDLASAKSVTVGETETVSGIDAVLTVGSTISGTVTKLIDGKVTPAAGVGVFVYATDGGDYLTGADTDAEGNYEVASLAAGSYKVGFENYGTSSSLASEYFGGGDDLAASETVTVKAGSGVTGIDAELEPVVVSTPTPPTPTPVPNPVPGPTPTTAPTTPTPPTTAPTTPTTAPAAAETVSVTVDGVTVTVPAAPIAQGGKIVVAADGFEPFEVVEIWLHSTPVRLGTLTANAQGEIRGTFSVPTGTPAGTHHIVMKDEAGVETQSAAITVVAKSATTPALAHTGTDVSGGWFALVFLLLGGLAVTVGARNRKKLALT
ncbi:MAG: carboxypeptidase regulatory-like domain-containing protein [Ramlibacter sp.]|nr:carboxypeptidase regulatory-like domain-containing protein [Cryobacterium sp.]